MGASDGWLRGVVGRGRVTIIFIRVVVPGEGGGAVQRSNVILHMYMYYTCCVCVSKAHELYYGGDILWTSNRSLLSLPGWT